MEEKKHRIAYALYSEQWKYAVNAPILLEELSEEVVPEDFSEEMKGKIFCPLCKTPLTRSPSLTSVSSNGITAHFKHGSKELYIESKKCGWRTPSAQGLKYNTEEEALRAIENQDLSIVNAWMEQPPTIKNDIDDSGEYDQTAIEDENGPETELAIGRHNGESYKLPSRLSTVMALCKEFPKNLKKGFFFPNSQLPMLLSDQLYSVSSISNELPERETLFFGKIIGYRRLSRRNVIMLSTNGIEEIKIYTDPDFDKRKRIDRDSVGRYVLFSAKLYWESTGDIVACKVLRWGAYSLLPEKYNKFLPGIS
jgi:hypothetical protein